MNSQKRLNLFQKICLLTIFSVLTLTGCGQSQVTTEESIEFEVTLTSQLTPPPSSTQKESFATPTVPTPSQTPVAKLTVDPKLFDVEITFPATWFSDQDMSTFDVEAYRKENDFKKAVINDDGSITVTMSKSKHKEKLDEYAATIDITFAELIDSQDYPYITNIIPTKDYSLVYIEVDRTAYDSTFIDFSPLIVGMHSIMYQTIAGIEPHSEIITRDNKTKEDINSIIYPDAFDQ